MEKLGKLIFNQCNEIIGIETQQSDGFGEGYIFKDMTAFHNKKGVCYIDEYSADDYTKYLENGGKPLTEDDFINEGFGIDYKTAIHLIKEELDDLELLYNEFICSYIAQSIIESAEYAHFSSYFMMIDDFEDWIISIVSDYYKIGSKCKWNDVCIDDYTESDRILAQNTIYIISKINNSENGTINNIDDIFLLCEENGMGEVECNFNEIELI